MTPISDDLMMQLIEEAALYATDPLGFVMNMWDWGEGDLENKKPEQYQVDILTDLGKAALTFAEAIAAARLVNENADIVPYRDSTSGGHGIGKSALMAWIIIWAMATHENTRGFITAGTDTQLKSKTVPEIMKWFRSCLIAPMFEMTTTRIKSSDRESAEVWRVDLIPWSEHNPDAFAGTHNEGNRILIIMDEAQQIPQNIYETVEGAMTDANTEIYWFMFGNPTVPNGPFFNTFGRARNSWNNRRVDSRKVSIANQAQIRKWEDEHGEESDFFRMRVRGLHATRSNLGVINSADVAKAQKREIPDVPGQGYVLGVDVGRHNDSFTIVPRNGFDARSAEWVETKGLNTIVMGDKVVEVAQQLNARAIFIDQTGVGTGVTDWLIEKAIDRLPMGCVVVPVNFGESPIEEMMDAQDAEERRVFRYRNSQMYWAMRKWMKLGAIPNDPQLETELISRRYKYYGRKNAIFLEPKEELKKRGLASPDRADGLALTFALPLELLDDVLYRDEDDLAWGGR